MRETSGGSFERKTVLNNSIFCVEMKNRGFSDGCLYTAGEKSKFSTVSKTFVWKTKIPRLKYRSGNELPFITVSRLKLPLSFKTSSNISLYRLLFIWSSILAFG